MIRERLELLTGSLTDSLFQDVMAVTTDDVKWNGIRFNHKTTFDDVIERAYIAYGVCTKYNGMCHACKEEGNPSKANYCFNCGEQLKNKAG